MTPTRARLTREDGTAALELALVLPVVVGLLGLILSTGWLFVQRAVLDRAGEIAARELVVGATLAEAAAEATARTPVLDLQPADFTATTSAVDGSDEVALDPAGAVASGRLYTVRVAVDVSPLAGAMQSLITGSTDGRELIGLAQGTRP